MGLWVSIAPTFEHRSHLHYSLHRTQSLPSLEQRATPRCGGGTSENTQQGQRWYPSHILIGQHVVSEGTAVCVSCCGIWENLSTNLHTYNMVILARRRPTTRYDCIQRGRAPFFVLCYSLNPFSLVLYYTTDERLRLQQALWVWNHWDSHLNDGELRDHNDFYHIIVPKLFAVKDVIIIMYSCTTVVLLLVFYCFMCVRFTTYMIYFYFTRTWTIDRRAPIRLVAH